MLLESYPNRLSGSLSNKKCADHISKLFEPYCKEVYEDSFYDYPTAFRKWPILVVFSYIISIILLWYDYKSISLIFFFFALVVSFRAGFLSKYSLKFLYGRKKLTNLIAKNHTKYKKTIIFSSHYDSAPILKISKYNSKFKYLVIAAFIILLFGFLILFINLFLGFDSYYFALFFTILLPIIFSLFLLIGGKESSLSAGDSLISIALLVELARHFKENPVEGVNIVYACFDGTKAGLIGSDRYYKLNGLALSGSDCININLNSLFSLKDLSVLNSDLNGSVSLNKNLEKRIINIASDMGYNIKSQDMTLFSGSTDAASAAKYNIPSISIIACDLENNISSTINDTIENIDFSLIGVVLNILIKFVEDYKLKKTIGE